MSLSETLVSALRALSSVPEIQANELRQFSESLEMECPLPDGSYGADPIWRVSKDAPPPNFFETLILRLRDTTGLVAENGYFAVSLFNYDIIVTGPTLQDVLQDPSHDVFTDAEFKLAILLVQGRDLKQAAAEDGTGYETKRTQFKSLSAKMGISGRSEVTRILTIRMMQRLTHLAQPESRVDLDTYGATYFPSQVRRLGIIASDGRSVPVIEYGPVTGSPLIVLHPMFFPPIGAPEIAQAEQLGIRLIWPLRPGFLDPEAPILNSKTHLEASTNGLIAVLEQLVGQPAPVLAFVSSGAVATRAAKERRDLVQSISFIATCYSAGRSSMNIPYFGAELAELALRNEAIMTRTVAAMRKYVSSTHRFRRMFENVFRASTRDQEHIAAEFDGPDKGERLRAVTLKSPESIKHDFFNQTQFRWSELCELDLPRRFLQGADDSIHPPDTLADILKDLDERPPVIDDTMGHLPHFSDLRRSIDFAVSWQIDPPTGPDQKLPLPAHEACKT